MDARLKFLSHSSLLLLHSCPRKYQLYRLRAQQKELNPDDTSSVTFAFGTCVGIGIQSILEGLTEQEWLLKMFLAWDADLLDNNPTQKKSFFLAIAAVQMFADRYAMGYMGDYELVYLSNGKPAIELSFIIKLPDGFIFRGFVDAVLKHKHTGHIMVLELKTSSASTVNPATFKNSNQALGYSVVLDKIFPGITSYEVLYLVYNTKAKKYEPLPFTKTLLQRALWLQFLLTQVELIKLYTEYELFPMHGESCFEWYRECEFLGLCTLSTELLVKDNNLKEEKEEDYDYVIPFEDLVTQQIQMGE